MRDPSPSPRSFARTLHRYHRLLGVCAALFVLVLTTTGLLLNHTSELELGSREVDFRPLLRWYGIKEPPPPKSFAVGQRWVSLFGDRLFLDEVPIPGQYRTLDGAAALPGLLVVAAEGTLLLISEEGDLIEALGEATGAPPGVQQLGTTPTGHVRVATNTGERFEADPDLSTWSRLPIADDETAFSAPRSPPPALLDRLREGYRGSGLPLERVLLDVHSGRILGAWGPYLVDLMALAFLLLAASGIVMWGSRRPNRSRKPRHTLLGRRATRRAVQIPATTGGSATDWRTDSRAPSRERSVGHG